METERFVERFTAEITLTIVIGILLSLVFTGHRGGMMANRTLRHKAEWPIILSVATKEGLETEDMVMLLAIRDAEAGSAGNEFGAMDVKNTDLYTQATSAARSLRNNRKRYQEYVQEGEYKGGRRTVKLKEGEEAMDFPEFMAYYGGPTGYGYAPIHPAEVSESHKKLNANWAPNVRKLTAQYQQQFKQKGVK